VARLLPGTAKVWSQELAKKQQKHAKEYIQVLTTCLREALPDYDERPNSYAPPVKGLYDHTLPAKFTFRPCSRRITELEAMNLFLVCVIAHCLGLL
jgi:hypothetical protein